MAIKLKSQLTHFQNCYERNAKIVPKMHCTKTKSDYHATPIQVTSQSVDTFTHSHSALSVHAATLKRQPSAVI